MFISPEKNLKFFTGFQECLLWEYDTEKAKSAKFKETSFIRHILSGISNSNSINFWVFPELKWKAYPFFFSNLSISNISVLYVTLLNLWLISENLPFNFKCFKYCFLLMYWKLAFTNYCYVIIYDYKRNSKCFLDKKPKKSLFKHRFSTFYFDIPIFDYKISPSSSVLW